MELKHINSINDLKERAAEKLEKEFFNYLTGGADDKRTLSRNVSAFQNIQIRPRRLVDVRQIDTSISLFGEYWASPIALAPIGWQGYFHQDGELATARAADGLGRMMIASTVSSYAYAEISAEMERKPWFQLYPTTLRTVTKILLQRAEDAGCPVVVLTVDAPVFGNRENHIRTLVNSYSGRQGETGNLAGLLTEGATPQDPSMTWDMIDWLRRHCNMKIVLKGMLTHEDAALAIEHGADAIIVSNHGGRQLESDLATIEALPEIVEIVQGKIPVIFDGGIRRGTDIFKALAIGADVVCAGRAYCYGLAAAGQTGVEKALTILQEELERNMKLAGVTSLKDLNQNFVRIK